VQPVEDYHRLLTLSKAEIVPYPKGELVAANRHLIRLEADVPVLLSAIACKPHWLLPHNTKHFTPVIGKKTGLRTASPMEFFRTPSTLFG
jgi:hypothetical protein